MPSGGVHPITRGVETIIAEFAYSAQLLKEAGFWGVEISAGHGHLFHQFMAATSNRRDDRYGGNLVNRTRLLTDLLAAIRKACGEEFLVGVKLPGEDGVPGGIDLEQAEEITAIVHATGMVSYLTYCWGSHADTLDWHLPDMHGERAPYIDKIARLGKSAPGTPLGALGLITDPNEGDRIVREGLADLVMLGRPLVTDPAWALKAAEGREASIRYCVSCNTCWHLISTRGTIQCDNNPRVGEADEADWKPIRVPCRRLVVVGAGPAGMEAAWTAAARGHHVTVFSAGDAPGGKTRIQALLPGGESLSSVYDYQHLQAVRYGASIVFGRQADLGDILAQSPDAVILATGSTPDWPDFLPVEYRDESLFPDVRAAIPLLEPFKTRQKGTALIVDKDQSAFTYAAAEFIAARFERVVLVTPRERIASAESLVNRQGIYRRLHQKAIEIILLSTPIAESAFEEGAVTLANIYTGATRVIENVSLLTFATPRVPNDALAAPLIAAGVEVHIIGDAFAPRLLLNATSEGHKIGTSI